MCKGEIGQKLKANVFRVMFFFSQEDKLPASLSLNYCHRQRIPYDYFMRGTLLVITQTIFVSQTKYLVTRNGELLII